MLTPARAATSRIVGREEFVESGSVNVVRLPLEWPAAEAKFKILPLQSNRICVIHDNVVL
jgi:hypothetical protein